MSVNIPFIKLTNFQLTKMYYNRYIRNLFQLVTFKSEYDLPLELIDIILDYVMDLVIHYNYNNPCFKYINNMSLVYNYSITGKKFCTIPKIIVEKIFKSENIEKDNSSDYKTTKLIHFPFCDHISTHINEFIYNQWKLVCQYYHTHQSNIIIIRPLTIEFLDNTHSTIFGPIPCYENCIEIFQNEFNQYISQVQGIKNYYISKEQSISLGLHATFYKSIRN